MVELDGLIYVLGGETEDLELTSVEVFDPHSNNWKMTTSMTMIRKVTLKQALFSQNSDDDLYAELTFTGKCKSSANNLVMVEREREGIEDGNGVLYSQSKLWFLAKEAS